MPARKQTRLIGRTWVNRYPPINGTSNGVTVSTDDTGLITVSGEVTDAEQSTTVSTSVGERTPVTPGAQLTGIQSRSSGDITFLIAFYDSAGSHIGTNLDVKVTGATATVPENAATMQARFFLPAGKTLTTGTFRVMLVDGDEAPDCFTAPGVTSAEPTNLVTAGRNLLGEGELEQLFSGGEYEVADGKVTLLMDDGSSWATKSRTNVLPPGDYALSADVEENPGEFLAEYSDFFSQGAPGQAISGTGHKQLLRFSSRVASSYAFKINGYPAFSGEVTIGDVQLEPGSATGYEAPTVTETALPEGLVLRSLPDGTADELVIRRDGTAYVERHTAYVESFTDEYAGENYFSSGGGLNAGDSVVYEVEQTVEELGTVTLPELPETFCEYPISDVPVRESVVYELG